LAKKWEFSNPSSSTWPEGSKLIFTEGSKDLLPSAVEEYTVPLASPGEKVEISCPIRVPTKPGRFQATFQLADKDRVPFEGHRCWVELVVAEEEKKGAVPEPLPKEPEVVAPKVEAPKVEAPKVEAPKVEAPKAEPKVEVAPKVEAKTEVPKPKEDQVKPKESKSKEVVDPVLQEKFKNQLGALESMGFSQLSVNVFLLQKYKGSIEQTISALVDMSKTR